MLVIKLAMLSLLLEISLKFIQIPLSEQKHNCGDFPSSSFIGV